MSTTHSLIVLLGWVGVLAAAPSFAGYSCTKRVQAPWFTVQVSGKVEGSPAPFSYVTWNRTVLTDRNGTGHINLTKIWYNGPGALIALEPADAEYRSSMTLRSEWVKRFQEAYRNKRREVEFELLRSGAFETEQSVRFWYEQFGAAPSFKIEAGKHYVSVPTDFSVSVSERQWRLSRPISASGSDIFSWRYDESEMVSVPNFPGRPAGVTIPAPQTFLTDVFLMGMDVGFVQKTVSFGLNPAYEANLRDSGCGTNWDRLLMEVSFGAAQVLSMAYFPLGLVAVGYWIYRLVVWFKSKKRRGAQPPPLPPPTIS